mgnify:CR=1 FL=1
MTRTRKQGVSRRATLAMMGAGAATLAAPWVARAQAKTIKIGMPTILSGRVAQLGTSSRNAVMLEVEKVNASGGLAGRQIEMVIRDSKGQPQEAARVARELVNKIQATRKEAGFEISDRIYTVCAGGPESMRALAEYGEYLMGETLSVSLVQGEPDGEYIKEWDVNGEKVTVGVRRVR